MQHFGPFLRLYHKELYLTLKRYDYEKDFNSTILDRFVFV